jgi:hypothetical protein
VKQPEQQPSILAAVPMGRAGFLFVASSRLVHERQEHGTRVVCDVPVPGNARIVCLQADGPVVLLETGQRFAWCGSGYVELPGVFDIPGSVTVRVRNDYQRGPGWVIPKGGTMELPESDAIAGLVIGIFERADSR